MHVMHGRYSRGAQALREARRGAVAVLSAGPTPQSRSRSLAVRTRLTLLSRALPAVCCLLNFWWYCCCLLSTPPTLNSRYSMQPRYRLRIPFFHFFTNKLYRETLIVPSLSRSCVPLYNLPETFKYFKGASVNI
jgi:hypothetical protein